MDEYVRSVWDYFSSIGFNLEPTNGPFSSYIISHLDVNASLKLIIPPKDAGIWCVVNRCEIADKYINIIESLNERENEIVKKHFALINRDDEGNIGKLIGEDVKDEFPYAVELPMIFHSKRKFSKSGIMGGIEITVGTLEDWKKLLINLLESFN